MIQAQFRRDSLHNKAVYSKAVSFMLRTICDLTSQTLTADFQLSFTTTRVTVWKTSHPMISLFVFYVILFYCLAQRWLSLYLGRPTRGLKPVGSKKNQKKNSHLTEHVNWIILKKWKWSAGTSPVGCKANMCLQLTVKMEQTESELFHIYI